jgi:hypothetical protein
LFCVTTGGEGCAAGGFCRAVVFEANAIAKMTTTAAMKDALFLDSMTAPFSTLAHFGRRCLCCFAQLQCRWSGLCGFVPGAHPADANVCFTPQTLCKQSCSNLNVTDVDDLMFELRHLVPAEPAIAAEKIQRIHGIIDHLVADAPVFQNVILPNS